MDEQCLNHFQLEVLNGLKLNLKSLSEEISKLAKLKNKGYLLEADVKYPKELHDSHNDLPFHPV